MTVSSLVAAVRDGLAEVADPVKAPRMRQYMRSTMPYRGVASPERKKLTARLFAAYPLADRAAPTIRRFRRCRGVRRSSTSAVEAPKGHPTTWEGAALQ
ncbi:MAG TPA: DNA alkylation repair protein [Pseudonocardiaceae bacterium]|nr:DNA alkylation repair protein [Pseudonocardiaceae bacterium]